MHFMQRHETLGIGHQDVVGFTLVEMIAVLVILGILTVAAGLRYASLQHDARNRGAQNLVAAAQTQLSLDFARMSVAGLPLSTPSQASCNLAISTLADSSATLECSGTLDGIVTINATIDTVLVSGTWSSPLVTGS